MVEPIEDGDTPLDQFLDGQDKVEVPPTEPIADPDSDLKSIFIDPAGALGDPSILNTILFWVVIIAIIFMVGRYSDTLVNNFKRLLSRDAEEDQMMA